MVCVQYQSVLAYVQAKLLSELGVLLGHDRSVQSFLHRAEEGDLQASTLQARGVHVPIVPDPHQHQHRLQVLLRGVHNQGRAGAREELRVVAEQCTNNLRCFQTKPQRSSGRRF